MTTPRPAPLERLPNRLAALLRWAQIQEITAVGSARREAFRFTRELIGATLAAGYPIGLIADCLGVSVKSAGNRAQNDGWLPAHKVHEGTGLQANTLRRWRKAGILTDAVSNSAGELAYPAAEVAAALAALRQPPSA